MKLTKWHLILSLLLIFALGGTNPIVLGQTLTTEDNTTVNIYPQNCGIYISGPDWICVNDDDDDADEKWDFKIEPLPGEDDTKLITITATADKSDASIEIIVVSGQDKIDGFWENQDKSGSKISYFTVPAGTSVTKQIYVEGIKHSSEWNDVVIKATLTAPEITIDGIKYKACSLEDTHELTVLQVDSDVDSHNDNAFDFAGFNDDEDEIENSIKVISGFKRPGKIIAPTSNLNSDNDDLPDYADGYNVSNVDPLTDVADVDGSLKFVPVKIELKEPFDPESAIVIITSVTESSPKIGEGLISHGEGTEESPKVIGVNNSGIRLWRKESTSRTSGDQVPDGDIVPLGYEVSWSDIADSDNAREAKLYIEYLETTPFQISGQKELTVVAKEGSVECHDVVKLLFIPADLDADTDNNNATDEPDRTSKEEGYQYGKYSLTEDLTSNKPGKMLAVNTGDEDYDGIPDYADGFIDQFRVLGINELGVENDGGEGKVRQSAKLTPIIFDLLNVDYDDSKIIVKFEYDDSDPSEIEVIDGTIDNRTEYRLPESGSLRLWTINTNNDERNNQLRSVKSITEGGHFVKDATEMTLAELKPLLEEGSSGAFVLYVESVKKSIKSRDQKLTIHLGVNEGGETNWIYNEAINFTSFDMSLVAIDQDGNTTKTNSPQLSHSSPVIDLETTSVSEPRFDSYKGWVVDIHVKGSITSDFLDTIPTEQGGTIDEAFIYLNSADEPIENGKITVQTVLKGSNPDSLIKPFPYKGAFDHTAVGVPVPDGKSIISVRTKDKVFQNDGIVAAAFEADFPVSVADYDSDNPGGGIGDDIGDETKGQWVLQVTNHVITFDENGNIDYNTIVNGVAGIPANYVNIGGGVYEYEGDVENDEDDLKLDLGDFESDPEERDYIVVKILDHAGEVIGEIILLETADDTKVFVATYTAWIWVPNVGDPVDPIKITDPVVIYESDGGEYYAHAYEVEGPKNLIKSFTEIKFEDLTELKAGETKAEFNVNIKELEDKLYIANAATPEAVGVVAFRERLEGDRDDTISEQLYAAITALQTKSMYPSNWQDFGKGFAAGVAKGGMDMVGGFGDVIKLGAKAVYSTGKAIVRGYVFQVKVLWKLASGQSLEQEIRQAKDLAESISKKIDYFDSLRKEGPTVATAILERKFEKLDNLSGAMKDMVGLGVELFAGLAESLTGPDYDKGVVWGRTTFEIGSSFFPLSKLGKVGKLDFLNKVKTNKFFSEGPGAAAYARAQSVHQKLPGTNNCFTADTLVHTSNGLIPIIDIKKGQLVLTMSDDGNGSLTYNIVNSLIVTSPRNLVQVTIDTNNDNQPDEVISGTPIHPVWLEDTHEFVDMGELLPGQKLRLSNGSSAHVYSIKNLRAPPGTLTYNIEVNSTNTYFVGTAGVWVHNNSIKFCQDFESRFTQRIGPGVNPTGKRMQALSDDFVESNKNVKAVPSHTSNMLILGQATNELKDYARKYAVPKNPLTPADIDELNAVWDYNKQSALRNKAGGAPSSKSGKVYTFELHHIAEKRLQNALGINPDNFDKSPTINLPRSKSHMPDPDVFEADYRQKFGTDPIYHRGNNGVTKKAADIFRQQGLNPNAGEFPNITIEQQKGLINGFKTLYKSTDPYKNMDAWPATRDYLRTQLTGPEFAELRNYLDNDAPDL